MTGDAPASDGTGRSPESGGDHPPPPAWVLGAPAAPPLEPATGPPVAPSPGVRERFATAYAEAPVTVSIVVVTVAVWLGHLALARWAGINTDLTLGDPGTAIHGEWWRLVTPMVVHFGVVHVGLNMFTLWRLGPPVEKVVGRRAYLIGYVVAGIGGQVASDLWNGTGVLSGGASGAIFGVIGVLVGNFVARQYLGRAGRRSTQQWGFNPKAVKSLAIQAAVWLALFSFLTAHIDNAAHIGGVLIGLIAGAVVAWVASVPAGAPPATAHDAT